VAVAWIVINVNDARSPPGILRIRPILDGIVANADDHICLGRHLVSGLIAEETNAPIEQRKQLS
jgi:hypothetical protein